MRERPCQLPNPPASAYNIIIIIIIIIITIHHHPSPSITIHHHPSPQQSPALAALDDVILKKGLFATKAFKKGQFITSLWGSYKLKVSEASSMQVIRILQNIPKQVKLFLKIDKRCAAFYINSPGLHEQSDEGHCTWR